MPPSRPQRRSQQSLFPASLSPFPDINIIIAPTPATGTPIKNGLENHRNPSNGLGTPLEPRWNTSGTPKEPRFNPHGIPPHNRFSLRVGATSLLTSSLFAPRPERRVCSDAIFVQARRGCSAFCPGSRKAFLGAGGRAYALWTQALPASMLTCERTSSGRSPLPSYLNAVLAVSMQKTSDGVALARSFLFSRTGQFPSARK